MAQGAAPAPRPGAGGGRSQMLDASSVPILLPELAVSPEAAPVAAEPQPSPSSPYIVLTLPTQPPLPSGDSALEPEQQAGGSERMREDRRRRPWPQTRLFFPFLLPLAASLVSFPYLIPQGVLRVVYPPSLVLQQTSSSSFVWAPANPLPLLFLRDQASPASCPVQNSLAWAGHWREPKERGAPWAGLLPAAAAVLPISSDTSLGGCQAPALPRETCFRRVRQVSPVPTHLSYDLMGQEPRPPPPAPGSTDSLNSTRGQRGERAPEVSSIAHNVRPDQDNWIPRGNDRAGAGAWGAGTNSQRNSPSASPGLDTHLTQKPEAPWSSALLVTPPFRHLGSWGLGWGELRCCGQGTPIQNKEGPHLGF